MLCSKSLMRTGTSRKVSSSVHRLPNKQVGRSRCFGPRSQRSQQKARPGLAPLKASLNLDQIPQEVLYAGAAGIALILGLVGYSVSQNQTGETTEQQTKVEGKPAEKVKIPRENAVLVFGATGKLGSKLVTKLVESGRTVVAAVRSKAKGEEALLSSGMQVGYQKNGKGILFVADGVDVTNPETLTAELFSGVTQVVSALGPVFGQMPDGTRGYLDNMTSERVDAQGVTHLVEAVKKYLTPNRPKEADVVPLTSETDIEAWSALDDVIMGGKSSSTMALMEDKSGAAWKGELIIEGGGFCGTRTKLDQKKLGINLADYDGICLRVKGDGSTFKMNLKVRDQENVPESIYQATFDTDPCGDWRTVFLPWHNFVAVKKNLTDPEAPPLDVKEVTGLALVYSRFEFNKMPNSNYKAGAFELQISGGLRAFKEPQPQIVMVSSAGVERNAIIGNDEEKRKKDIPIVQLNPGGTLNHKYTGEIAVRTSGYPYTVVRSTGLYGATEDAPALLEVDQGDIISGRVSREEVADVIVKSLGTSSAAGKTFELRRSEAADAKGKAMTDRDYLRLFLRLAKDTQRWRVGLLPFPAAVPPPAAVTEERKKEILSDERVQATMNRQQQQTAAQAAPSANGASVPPNVAEARQWIAAWRAKGGENGAGAAKKRQDKELAVKA